MVVICFGTWADSLVVDIGGDATGPVAWTGWNAEVQGALNTVPRMPNKLDLTRGAGPGWLTGFVPLPTGAQGLAIFGDAAGLRVTVQDRQAAQTRAPAPA